MGRLLIVTQVFPPDATAVGQYLADLAHAVAADGRPVTVLTADRDYSDPSIAYPPYEYHGSLEVIRLPASSFGKTSIAVRLAGAASFLGQAMARGLRLEDVDRLLVSTSPPLAAAVGLFLHRTRRIPMTYWVMDLNPDQAVAMKAFSPHHPAVRVFDAYNRRVLRTAEHVIALDEFMAKRLRGKHARAVEVLPPWPLQEHVAPVPHTENPFRREQGWRDESVVMFSGNMSPTSPIDTVVDAAEQLRERQDIVFAFIGGGAGKRALEERLARRPIRNVVVLPYQPLESLRYSLSAADLHVVTMGDAMVGITHPCKVYSAMAVGRPLLAVAPERSHVGELVSRGGGWRVDHGDVRGAVRAIEALAAATSTERRSMGETNLRALEGELSAASLKSRLRGLV